jgi:hypothetical protein
LASPQKSLPIPGLSIWSAPHLYLRTHRSSPRGVTNLSGVEEMQKHTLRKPKHNFTTITSDEELRSSIQIEFNFNLNFLGLVYLLYCLLRTITADLSIQLGRLCNFFSPFSAVNKDAQTNANIVRGSAEHICTDRRFQIAYSLFYFRLN